MKKIIIITATCLLSLIIILITVYRKEISLICKSLNGFKEENLADTFQNMYNIQPVNKINKGNKEFNFDVKEEELPKSFTFENEDFSIPDYLKETKTSGLLVIKDDVIKHESYYLGADENTLFASNSMGKSFVSALMGIAISEGHIKSVDERLGKYIPEFVGTELENLPIKACLQMASGINFDEDDDMSKYSVKTLLGFSAMKQISKVGLMEEPFSHRRYLSINTEILGEVIRNATGYGLAEYMQEKLWKKLNTENDAFWTLSNNKELAMGGLSISLRDYAKFAKLYMDYGKFNNEQIIPKQWVEDSMNIDAFYSKPGANNDSYNDIGYGYQWWIPEGSEDEFMAIGVYSQWIYVNRDKNIIIVKTSADSNFMAKNYELKHVELFREIANEYK